MALRADVDEMMPTYNLDALMKDCDARLAEPNEKTRCGGDTTTSARTRHGVSYLQSL